MLDKQHTLARSAVVAPAGESNARLMSRAGIPDRAAAEYMMQATGSMAIMSDLMRIALADRQDAITTEQCTLQRRTNRV